ncbi:MAG: hypothetical protein WCN98_18645 [Verrucomicrobiaceae bacterium]
MIPRISEYERPHIARFVIIFAVIVVSWAAVHDAYLIGVDARHFTEFHPPLLPIQNHILLAIQYAATATLGPALAYGFLAYLACRFGPKKSVGIKYAALGFVLLILSIEMLLLAIGQHARSRFESGHGTFYPDFLYPELSPGIIFTQSVNISAYLFAPLFGAIYLLVIYKIRKAMPPIQVLDPTPMFVTDRADARSAPSTGAAQL